MLMIYLHYVFRTLIDLIKENGFTLKKTRNRRYPAETRTDTNYADDLALLSNTTAQAKSLLYTLKEEARSWSPRERK